MLSLLASEDRKGSDISILNFTLAFGICLEDSSVFALCPYGHVPEFIIADTKAEIIIDFWKLNICSFKQVNSALNHSAKNLTSR